MEMACTVRLFLLLLSSPFFLVPITVFAQTDGKVSVGASRSATSGNNNNSSSFWLSPSGDYAFGFRQLEQDKDMFLLSVWYANIPDLTVVWYAYGEDSSPAVAPKGSVLNLTASSGLVLTDPQGQQLWNTSVNGVALGVFNDTGNFVLEDENSQSLWETFKNPTHTMLPGQVIERGGKLSSQQSETNYSKGRFQLRLLNDGNVVLNTINLPTEFANKAYYVSGTNDSLNSTNSGKQLVFNSSGYLYVVRENGEKNLSVDMAVSTNNYYRRVTLGFDGVLSQYYYPKDGTSNATWTVFWSLPEEGICNLVVDAGLNVCGYNSICTLTGPSPNQRPICECPQGYSGPYDPYGDCKPDFIQGCEEDELSATKEYLYEVVVRDNTNWPNSDYMRLSPSTADSCKESCLEDCLCAVAIFSRGDCWKKKLPVSNGREESGSTAFIKVRKGNVTLPLPPPLSPPDGEKRKNKTTLIRVISALLGTSILANLMFGAVVCMGFYFIYRRKHGKFDQKVSDSNLQFFSYQELEEATNGFLEELGKGAFGVVYKGVLHSGVQVAVKKLRFVVQDSEKEFRAELDVIGQTHHKNLVRLYGYCDEGQQRLIVYELLSDGTLASFLFSGEKPSWKERIDIVCGVAKGLLYLHDECSTQIIHCDIKPQNILLDEYHNARIADFGLAKLLMMNQSQTQTAIRGTKGYVAPEWFRNMPITTKVDVYSFGVVLLEAICCRRSVDLNVSEDSAILTYWVYDCYMEGVLDVVVDHEAEPLQDAMKLERLVMVAIWCIQEDPSVRPDMKKVVQMLEGVAEVHVPPCPSPYSRTTNFV